MNLAIIYQSLNPKSWRYGWWVRIWEHDHWDAILVGHIFQNFGADEGLVVRKVFVYCYSHSSWWCSNENNVSLFLLNLIGSILGPLPWVLISLWCNTRFSVRSKYGFTNSTMSLLIWMNECISYWRTVLILLIQVSLFWFYTIFLPLSICWMQEQYRYGGDCRDSLLPRYF